MVSAVSGILGRDASGGLPSNPNIWVDLSKEHWVPPIRISRRFNYIYFIASDHAWLSIWGAAPILCGISAKWNNLGLLPDHSVVDSPALAIEYDINHHTKISNMARGRTPDIDYTALISEEQHDVNRYAHANLSERQGRWKGMNGGKGDRSNPNRTTDSEPE